MTVVLNGYRGRREVFWSSAKPSVVRLGAPSDIPDEMGYVLANGVAAGLVPRAADRPGLTTNPAELLRPDAFPR